jgi:multicomponent Na+:H+ antiporter subunit F
MNTVLGLTAGLLALTLLVGLVRVLIGPGMVDRMLAAQLFGTTGVAILLVSAEQRAEPALRDVALVLAMLGVVATVAFVARVWRPDAIIDPPSDPHPPPSGPSDSGDAGAPVRLRGTDAVRNAGD